LFPAVLDNTPAPERKMGLLPVREHTGASPPFVVQNSATPQWELGCIELVSQS